MSTRLPGMGRREWLAGKIGLKLLGYAGKRALKRDDVHEATHILAMMAYGDSSHRAPCMLPEDIDARLSAYSAAGR